MSEIPHPFIIESLDLFSKLSKTEKEKIYFIHLNHTNPVLDKESKEYENVVSKGFNIAEIDMKFYL
jgi:pyrroloquinoline quinone biosynthesis protein B